jgi:hypothetical protein
MIKFVGTVITFRIFIILEFWLRIRKVGAMGLLSFECCLRMRLREEVVVVIRLERYVTMTILGGIACGTTRIIVTYLRIQFIVRWDIRSDVVGWDVSSISWWWYGTRTLI